MSLDSSGDGIRVITPIVFFPPGSQEARPLNAVTKVKEESEEKSAPKDSSVPASASSSSEPVDPEQDLTDTPSPVSLVPPAPQLPSATVDKGNGPPKASESSTPVG